jgi:hypothetical protein
MVPELTVNVDVGVPPELRVRLVGLTDAVNPVPDETDRLIVPVNPLILEAVMVEDPEEPASMLTVGEFEVKLKSAGPRTVRLSVTECERLPLVPVTRIV